MGQAKQRGTKEQRVAQAIERDRLEAIASAERTAAENLRLEGLRLARQNAVILGSAPQPRRRSGVSRRTLAVGLSTAGMGARIVSTED